MHRQKLRNPKLGTLKGLLIVAFIVAVMLLDSYVVTLIAPYTGDALAMVFFWAAGALLVLWTMRHFVLSYSYTLSSSALHITFAYGRYERTFEDIYLNNIVAAGDLDALKARYSGARICRATRRNSDIPQYAVAANDGSRLVIYLLQPDETIREALENAAMAKRKKSK